MAGGLFNSGCCCSQPCGGVNSALSGSICCAGTNLGDRTPTWLDVELPASWSAGDCPECDTFGGRTVRLYRAYPGGPTPPGCPNLLVGECLALVAPEVMYFQQNADYMACTGGTGFCIAAQFICSTVPCGTNTAPTQYCSLVVRISDSGTVDGYVQFCQQFSPERLCCDADTPYELALSANVGTHSCIFTDMGPLIVTPSGVCDESCE